MEGIEESYCT